ncbi:hypothetical protein Hanom_Chr13g01208881 [Helianthus anomalus]
MIKTWDTSESCKRKMIPYVRLINAMILQQNALPQESLWVSKPIDQFNIASMKLEDDQGNNYNYTDPREAEEGGHDEEMVDEEDETEPAGPRGPRQRYRWQLREISADVENFVNQRRRPSYKEFNRGQLAVYDNVLAGMGEGREYEVRRKTWEEMRGAQW